MASFSDIGTISQESILNSDLEEMIRNEWTDNICSSQIIREYVDVNNMQIAGEQLSELSEQGGFFNSTGSLPCMDEYAGHFNFEMYADGSASSRNSWEYSHSLNKVFLDLKKVLLIQFKTSSHSNGLRVRALLVYKEADLRSIAVNRCRVHIIENNKNDMAHREKDKCFCDEYNWVGHVIQSSHPKACYEYNPLSKRHSVIVPLDPVQAGSETVTVPYIFTCKTSCISGMNRNPVSVIFTLENSLGVVIGRRILSVKVCSCPKRDKKREEYNHNINQDQQKEEEKPVPRGKYKPGYDSNSIEVKRIKIEEILTSPVTPVTTYDNFQDQSSHLGQESSQKLNQIQNELIQLHKEFSMRLTQLQNHIEEFKMTVLRRTSK